MSMRGCFRAGCSCGPLVAFLVFANLAFPQSTGTIQGTVTDTSGAPVPAVAITVHNQRTGEERATTTDSSGIYLVPSLPVGTYRVSVKAPGMAPMTAGKVEVSVGSTVKQDFSLKVASTTETVEVTGAPPVIDTSSVSVGSVVNQDTVQEIPLNGRHFVDLAAVDSRFRGAAVQRLSYGSVARPGVLFVQFRGRTRRQRQLHDQRRQSERSEPEPDHLPARPSTRWRSSRVDNSTFSAEYGRNSGSIVNIATRSGVDQWHGEAYEFVRNNDLDARNFSNPTFTGAGATLTANPQSPFKRNQFGGDAGGALQKDKTFIFLTFEALRQRQAVPISTTTLSAAQRAQAQATSDPLIQNLLPLIPAANSGTNQYASSAVAPVNIEQGTANFSQVFSDKQQRQRLLRHPARPAQRAALHRCQQLSRRRRPEER